MQITLRMIVLGQRDFHLGVERKVMEVGRSLEYRRDVGVGEPVVLDVEEADAAAGVRDRIRHRAAASLTARPGRGEVDDGDVSEIKLAGGGQHWGAPGEGETVAQDGA